MRRLPCLAITVTLLLAAPTQAARIEIDPSSVNFSLSDFTFSFELVLTDRSGLNDTGDWLRDNVIGFDVGVTLTDINGNNHPRLVMDEALMQKSAAMWQTETVGDYMFALFGVGATDGNAVTTSSVLSDAYGVNLLTCSILDQRGVGGPPPPTEGVKPRVGQVVAKFVTWWDGAGIPLLYVDFQAGSLGNPDSFFVTNAEGGGPIVVSAIDGVLGPEPGSLSLLALGLGAMIIRRRRRQ